MPDLRPIATYVFETIRGDPKKRLFSSLNFFFRSQVSKTSAQVRLNRARTTLAFDTAVEAGRLDLRHREAKSGLYVHNRGDNLPHKAVVFSEICAIRVGTGATLVSMVFYTKGQKIYIQRTAELR